MKICSGYCFMLYKEQTSDPLALKYFQKTCLRWTSLQFCDQPKSSKSAKNVGGKFTEID